MAEEAAGGAEAVSAWAGAAKAALVFYRDFFLVQRVTSLPLV